MLLLFSFHPATIKAEKGLKYQDKNASCISTMLRPHEASIKTAVDEAFWSLQPKPISIVFPTEDLTL
jgi:hypothetical protein